MPAPRDAALAFKLSVTERRELERAAKLQRTTLSESVRSAALSAARETIVTHAIETPLDDDDT